MRRVLICALALVSFCSACLADDAQHSSALDGLIARYAHMHGIPESLLRRVIARESGYKPAAFNRRFYGLMQLTYSTARSMGYRGAPKGLFDPEVNLTYGVPYLANAYRLADGNETRAVQLYSGGYYAVAKRRKLLDDLRTAASPSLEPKPAADPATASADATKPATDSGK
jgi:soluble lytic murein transglycosylase-like protein